VVGVCEAEGRGEQTKLGPLERALPRCPICKVDLLRYCIEVLVRPETRKTLRA
jgi:hypothetical protein